MNVALRYGRAPRSARAGRGSAVAILVVSVGILAGTVGFGPTGLGQAAQAATLSPTDFSAAMTVTTRTVTDAQVPVSVDLPAPGDGVRVSQVTYSWRQKAPTATTGSIFYARTTVPTPDCVADQPCHLEQVLPTGRMIGSTIDVIASDGTSILGSKGTAGVNDPKPTVTMTAPANYGTWWGTVPLTADAAPSTAGVPLKGVRFYLNPNGLEDQSYLFDDTAPYSVAVPATDVAAANRTGIVWAVAEDVQGHLSDADPAGAQKRTFTVGPPPEIAWAVPAGDGRPDGRANAEGLSDGSLLGWHAAIPDDVPSDPTHPWGEPYIARVELLLDGAPWADMPADHPIWANFATNPRYRTVDYNNLGTHLAAGTHTFTLRVTTSYGSVATADRRIVVTDGVEFSPLKVDGVPVVDGKILTGGTIHNLAYTVTGKVPGSVVSFFGLTYQGGSLTDGTQPCQALDWWTCPGGATVRGQWAVPTRPGTYTIDYQAQESQDDTPTRRSVTFTVQAATRLPLTTSTTRVRDGARVTVTGHFVRTDPGHSGAGVAGVPVKLQWRRAGTTTWLTQLSTRTGAGGWVSTRALRHHTGTYRYVAAGISGTYAPATSPTRPVYVRR
jgi:hypothetical protein